MAVYEEWCLSSGLLRSNQVYICFAPMTRIQTPVQLAQLAVRALRLRGWLRLDETRRSAAVARA